MDFHMVAIDTFWQTYLQSLASSAGLQSELPPAWGFGNTPQMADELGALVKSGIKTATCSLLWEFESDGEPIPAAGEYSLILDGSGNPICIIQTTDVSILPFVQVQALHAWEEGEGDRSLEYWRAVHWRYFSPICLKLGRQPALDMPLVCERFRLVYAP